MSAENAIHAIHLILGHEGGYVNHKDDPGGATNMGVTLETFRRYIKPGGSIEDLKALTREQAVIVFKRHYWDAVLADFLPSGVDYAVADFAVNSGPARAARFLQAIVGATQDGMVGPATLAAVAKWEPKLLAAKLCDKRLAWLQTLGTWSTFGRGWSARVSEVRATSMQWAEQEPDGSPVARGQSWLARLLDLLTFWK